MNFKEYAFYKEYIQFYSCIINLQHGKFKREDITIKVVEGSKGNAELAVPESTKTSTDDSEG